MPAPILDPTPPTSGEPDGFRSRFPRALWIGVAIIVLVVVVIGYSLKPSAERPQTSVQEEDDLWKAAKRGELQVVEAWLANGADPDAETEYGATALHFAAARGHLDIVRALLAHGANVNARDTFYGATPLLLAAEKQQWRVVGELLEAGAQGADAIVPGAAAAGALDVVRLALNTGRISAAALDRALAAAPRDQTQLIKLLEKAGARRADPASAETTAGNTAASPETRLRFQEPAEPDADDLEDIVPKNWPSFRGPQGTGIADGQKPPTNWDAQKGTNVRWRRPIAGLAHACPIVWDNRVYITTAVRAGGKSELKVGLYGDVDSADDLTEHSWRICCLDKNSGEILWERTAHRGVPHTRRHTKGSHANCTPATDGTHVIVNFGSEGLCCYDTQGRLLWRRDLGTLEAGWFFDDDYQWGFGSSPVIFRDLAIIQCDVGRGSYIAGLRMADGSVAWRTGRDEIPSWGSPGIVEGPDRAELVTNATRFARGYDPLTGEELWRLARQSEITVPTPFYGEGLIFIASGYSPIQPIYAIRPGASGDISLGDNERSNDFVSWSTLRGGPYLPTPIAYRGLLYVCSNDGIVVCYDAPTGREIYKRRLPGAGAYTASPVAADGKVYFTNEQGEVTVLKAGARFELLAQNALGEVCLATPAISDGALFFRTEGHVIAVARPHRP